MFFCYILYSEKLDRFYIGSTQNLKSRFRKHMSNHKGFTSKAKDWKIVFVKEFDSKSKAMAYERKLKSWKSRKQIAQIING